MSSGSGTGPGGFKGLARGLSLKRALGADASSQTILGTWLGLGARPIFAPPPSIQDRWFKDTTIYLDGYTFEQCRFDGCRLVIEYGSFTLRNCFIAADCQLIFGATALKIVQTLLHMLGAKDLLPQAFVGEFLKGIRNPDGTLTLE